MKGKCKWFADKKGYGFVTSDAGKDAFVHHSEIKDQDGRRTLTEGEVVTFDVKTSDKGPTAVNVKRG